MEGHSALGVDTDRLEQRLRTLERASRAFQDFTTGEVALVNRLAKLLADEIGETCSLRLLSDDGQHFENLAIYHPDPEIEQFMREVMGSAPQGRMEGFSGLALEAGEAMLVPVVDPEMARRVVKPAYHGVLDRIGLTSGLLAPLKVHGKAIGIVFLARHNPPHRPYDHYDLAVLQDVADRAAIALEAARLRDDLARIERERAAASGQHAGAVRRFRGAFEDHADAYVLTDADGRILALNASACRLFGHAEADLRELGWSGVVDSQEPGFDAARAVVFPEEVRFVRAGGVGFVGEVVSSRFREDDGAWVALVGIRDVTERQRLLAAHARLAAIVTHSEDAIFTVSPHDLTVMDWNPGAEALFGYPAEAMVGRNVLRLVPLERIAKHVRNLADLERGEEIPPYDSQRLHRDGSLVDVSIGLFPIKDPRGRIIQYAVIMRDIRARMQAMEQAAELQKARELGDLKDRFLSTISHEIKTPLTLIQGYTELLQDKYPEESLMDAILDGSDRLTRQINQILIYSALVGESVVLDRQALSVGEALDQALQLVSERLGGRGLHPALLMPEALPLLDADPRWLVEMLGLLLDHAACYARDEGQLAITASARDGCVRVELRVDVHDLPGDVVATMWEAFAQVQRHRSATCFHGLGLGLAIVKLLAELHGGGVGASISAKCLAIYVELPGEPPR